MTRLQNKVALITGSSRGIGRATALAFAREGAALVGVHYTKDADAAHATVRELEALGTRAVAVQADLRAGKAAAERIRDQLLAVTDQLDILVNNAGIAPAISLKDTTVDQFDEIMAINFAAPFFLIQALADRIRDHGRIINISTGFTRVAAPTHPVYAASKGALETLTLALAPDLGRRNITVNVVMPGVTATDMNAEWLAQPEARAGVAAMSVFSRVGEPGDIADIVTLVASSEARWLTGQVLDATGGFRI